MSELNREGWLTEISSELASYYKQKGFVVPEYRVTCGWPCVKGLGLKSRRIGECHSAGSSKAGVFEIFISPTLEDPLFVSGVLAHELVHAAVGVEAAHGPKYKRACRHLGLVGKPTQAEPGDFLNQKILRWIESTGPYPHRALEPTVAAKKPSKSYAVLECPGCGCVVRMTPRWLERAGSPVCGCGLPLSEKEE